MNFSRLNLLIGQWAKRFGFSITRTEKERRVTVEPVPLAMTLIRRLQHEIKIVQLGAHDGQTADPIHEFLQKDDNSVRALLIEPQPEPYKKLQERYREREKICTDQCAVADFDGEVDFHMPAGDTMALTASRDPVQVTKHFPGGCPLTTMQIPCCRLSTLLERHAFVSIDFLQIDCEGFDAQIIQGAFAEGIFPLAIYFETSNLSMEDLRSVRSALEKYSYGTIEYSWDCLALHKDLIT